MADSDIRKITTQALLDLFTSESVSSEDIAWENTKFNADRKPLWFRVTYNPNTPSPVTLGLGGRDRANGFIQVDINTGQGAGVGAFDYWEDLFRQKFFAGKTFTNSTNVVRIISVGMSGGRIFEKWFRKSVTVAFRADLIRNSNP